MEHGRASGPETGRRDGEDRQRQANQENGRAVCACQWAASGEEGVYFGAFGSRCISEFYPHGCTDLFGLELRSRVVDFAAALDEPVMYIGLRLRLCVRGFIRGED